MYGIEAMLDAFVMAYLPGDYGARAIADVLSGAFNPSGRLPFTWSCHPSSHLTHDLKHTELEGDGFKPLFAFGDGLSYATVNTTDLTMLGGDTARVGETVTVEVTLENTGNRSSTETIILYSQDRVASITPPPWMNSRPTNRWSYLQVQPPPSPWTSLRKLWASLAGTTPTSSSPVHSDCA